MTLSRVYSFWKFVSNLDRRETRRYLEMLYILKMRPLINQARASLQLELEMKVVGVAIYHYECSCPPRVAALLHMPLEWYILSTYNNNRKELDNPKPVPHFRPPSQTTAEFVSCSSMQDIQFLLIGKCMCIESLGKPQISLFLRRLL